MNGNAKMLQAFTTGTLQDILTILSLFKNMPEMQSAVRDEIGTRLIAESAKKIQCEKCGFPVDCMAVNTKGKKCRQVGGGYKSLNFCSNTACNYAEYSHEDCN